ncbi:fantom-like [Solea senegalensis]|uniref:Fantom-like n=2 Tax=Solea senegalensis TaxID=28829 RepID=A0AAV6QVK5_SOLSE|nr:protein fantom isoform X1 [Solea senegalensis]XP_043877806.1 protein fantom isoform X1 [Solea senegalensis]KAG7496363.1 fantom-like [Solea senegalensis]
MSPTVDETAADLPVRDVGLMRGGLMPAVPDTLRDGKPSKKHHIIKVKDPQRLFRFPREHLEDLCLRLQEENSVLRQHARAQEQRLRRMSTRLMRHRQAHSGSGGVKERDMEDTVQELEARVSMLESQKEVLQNKLSLAKQNIMDLGRRTPYKISKAGKSMEVEGTVRRAAQTAPSRYGPMLEDNRVEMEGFRSCVTEPVRVTEFEVTALALRDTLREKEKEVEGTMREMRKQQSDRHRITIRENVDLIHLQKELSNKNTALRVTQMKLDNLEKAFENQLEESQGSLRESLGALLEKVEELTEQLKQEKQRALALQDQLTTASMSMKNLDKLQERISDLETERDMIKENYDSLLENTFSAQISHDNCVEKRSVVDQKSQDGRLEEILQTEREKRGRLELEKEKLRQEKEMIEEQRDHERELSEMMRVKQEQLEREVLQHREQVSALQGRLDSVTKGFDMSVEELSETLLQIKVFRMQQESSEGLRFLCSDGKVEDLPHELVNIQATLAETVLELQKTRNLLLVEHQICKDLKEELNTVSQRMEREREQSRMMMAEKDKLLSKRVLQINTLQAQLKELAYSPRNYKWSIPVQYTWPAGDQEVVQPIEDDMSFSQLRAGESLLEIHLKAATFTPAGLRVMSRIGAGVDTASEDFVTFCTYSLLDFEMHSTPLVSGSQPNYGFTSRYALTARDLGRLGGQGSRVRVELHQALGGVNFVTHGSGQMSLMSAIERRGQRVNGRVKITGPEAESIGVVDFWVRLFPPAEPMDTAVEKPAERRTAVHRGPPQIPHGWQDTGFEELLDYGGGIPNELVVMLERCVGLSTRWPGLLPDGYLTYRFYDLPPHVSKIVQCTADPVFYDTTSYPLAVSADVLHYLRSSSLWVYVFDDSDDQMQPAYLAKTPIPLRALATGREIRGDYVLRDPAGGPRGTIRVMIKWKYPFHPLVNDTLGRQGRQDRPMENADREERRKQEAEVSQKPIAKPRVKIQSRETKAVQELQPPSVKQKISHNKQAEQNKYVRSTDRKTSTKRSADLDQGKFHVTPEPLTTPSHSPDQDTSEGMSPRQSPAMLSRGSSAGTQELLSVDQESVDEEEEEERRTTAEDTEANDSSETSTSQSDIVIISPKLKMRKRDKLRVEILSLAFEPSSRVALDKSVQQVYVEYRLLGVAMETTETPVSLRKPTKGEEIYYNFTRVIYVDGSQSGPLRQYLYTMLEGNDPNQGRLKFTVVSEPMDDDEECVDIGQAFLNLQELLLTGNNVIEQQIDIISVDEDKEVIGNLKVSLEAAKALTRIYQEFQPKDETEKDDNTDEEEEEEEEEKREETKKEDQIQVTDHDIDSDF